MIIAAQPHAFPLRRFARMPSAGRERSRQSVSPLLSSLCERVMASTRCMQLAALAAVGLLAAEAWGVSNALATRLHLAGKDPRQCARSKPTFLEWFFHNLRKQGVLLETPLPELSKRELEGLALAAARPFIQNGWEGNWHQRK
jgi:hypothetical protein